MQCLWCRLGSSRWGGTENWRHFGPRGRGWERTGSLGKLVWRPRKLLGRQGKLSLEGGETSFTPGKTSFAAPETSLATRETSFDALETSFKGLETSFKPRETSFEARETSFEGSETSLTTPETSFGALETSFGTLQSPFGLHCAGVRRGRTAARTLPLPPLMDRPRRSPHPADRRGAGGRDGVAGAEDLLVPPRSTANALSYVLGSPLPGVRSVGRERGRG